MKSLYYTHNIGRLHLELFWTSIKHISFVKHISTFLLPLFTTNFTWLNYYSFRLKQSAYIQLRCAHISLHRLLFI
jgi:hypothetical protein